MSFLLFFLVIILKNFQKKKQSTEKNATWSILNMKNIKATLRQCVRFKEFKAAQIVYGERV